jgi:hypothetical protein
MGYHVSYSGAIEVQPPLSDAHANLVEVRVDLEDSEYLRPTLEAIKSSEEPDLPNHGGQTYISEDCSKIEASRRATSRTQTLARPSGEAFLHPRGLHPQWRDFMGRF